MKPSKTYEEGRKDDRNIEGRWEVGKMGLVKIYNGVKSMFDFDVAEGGTRKNNV